MAVFCEFISLIILRDSIDKYFPGGWKRFVLEVPNRSMATDGEVVRVGFMNPVDTNIYLEFLKGEGLQFRQSGDREIDDISDLDQFMGHLEERQWLEFGDRVFNERKYFCAWKKGSLIDSIAMSSFSGQVMPRLPPEILNKRLSYLRTQNGLDIYLDTKYGKGKEFYLPEGMSIEEHYEYYSDWRKELENKRIKKNEKLEEEIDKDLIEKQKAQELIDYEVSRALDKRLEEDRLIQQKKDQEFRKTQERKQVIKKRAKDRVHDNETERNRLQTQNGKRSKIWFIDDIQPENFSDDIGKILKEYNENPLNTMKKEKRQILDRLHKKGIKQGYIFFGGYSHNYGLSRVGDSYIYDVPAKKTGNLRKFRNQKIRVICVGSGTRFIRSYLAGPII